MRCDPKVPPWQRYKISPSRREYLSVSSPFEKIDAAGLSNVSELLSLAARQVPDHTAVAVAKRRMGPTEFDWDVITYAQLDQRATEVAKGLLESGIPKGSRLALMVKPGVEFISLVFGMMRASMVQILIDPGMGRSNMIHCLQSTDPEGFVAIPLAHVARCVFRKRFPNAIHNVTVGKRWFWGGRTYQQILEIGRASKLTIGVNRVDDAAAIIFTTGSTGPPKGVAYTHKMFIGQATQIRDYYDIQPGGVDLSGFPLFALFNIGMGMTTVIPQMDPTRPADVNPQNIIDAVNHWKADQSFGSPALWNTVSLHCEKNSIRLPTLKRVFSAGAPVPPHVLERVKKVIADDGEIYTPYGATESLPVASNSASVILGQTAEKSKIGAGTCVGGRFPGIQWKVIRISDDPIQTLDQCSELSQGEIGELMVTGDVVSQSYVTSEQANALHKVKDGATVWHRMGDVGYLDQEERFWFCGRKGHRVICGGKTLYTIPVEAIINEHAAIYRSAMVGVGPIGNQIPAVVLQPWSQHFPKSKDQERDLLNQIREMADGHDLTSQIQHYFVMQKLPVDIRHNSKIFREKIAIWVAKKMHRQIPGI